MSAVEELQKIGSAQAITAERLLHDERMQATLRGKVVILDEAGMISGRQMWELLRLVRRQSARLVFSGDTKQIQSIEAGDTIRVIEKEPRLKSVALAQVQRQTRRSIERRSRSCEGAGAWFSEAGGYRSRA